MKKGSSYRSKIVRMRGSTLEALSELKSRPEETYDMTVWRLILEHAPKVAESVMAKAAKTKRATDEAEGLIDA